MPSKYQEYRQMADTAERQLTSSYKSWAQFLRTAARLYKYPYNEQVMIHAQRPDATACAEYDFWNKKMGRFVRRGSTGIALIDTSGQKPQLRYVFDVADTGEREHSRPIDGEWQDFPSADAAEQAAYADFKASSHRNAQNFHITDDALGVGGAKAKFRANMAAIHLLQELEFEGLQASPEQQEILSRYVGWGGLADAFDENKPNWADEFAELYATLCRNDRRDGSS